MTGHSDDDDSDDMENGMQAEAMRSCLPASRASVSSGASAEGGRFGGLRDLDELEGDDLKAALTGDPPGKRASAPMSAPVMKRFRFADSVPPQQQAPRLGMAANDTYLASLLQGQFLSRFGRCSYTHSRAPANTAALEIVFLSC